MVFDDNDRIATGRKPTQEVPKNLDILQMEACCRFVEQVDHFRRRTAAKFRGKLQALGFTTRKRRHRLTEFHIREAHIAEAFELRQNLRLVLEELAGFDNAHVKHIGNVLALERDGKNVTVSVS